MSTVSKSIADISAGQSSHSMPDTECGDLPSGYDIVRSLGWGIDRVDARHVRLGSKQPSHMLHTHPEKVGVVTHTRKRKRGSNWTKDETSKLISLKKEFADPESRTCKGSSEWDTIAKKMAESRTGDQCRRRWDTVVKSYHKIKAYCENKKAISELTQAERAELKLATTMSEDWWYDVIGQVLQPRRRKIASVRLEDASILDVTDDLLRSNLPLVTPLAPSFECGESFRGEAVASEILSPVTRDSSSAEASDPSLLGWSPSFQPTRKSYPEQMAIPGYASMPHNLKNTLVNLILAWPTISFNGEMEAVCRWLAIMQDRQTSETRSFVLELRERELLTFSRNEKAIFLKLGHLQVYSKFAKQMVRTHCHRVGVSNMLTFESMSPRREIKVLTLLSCLQLERVDLGNFPTLRSLVIKNCPLLESVCGWDKLPELRWLEIDQCRSYRTYPELHCLPSLREARFDRRFSPNTPVGFEPSFGDCTRLSRLELSGDAYLKESGDLSALKCLKLLSFLDCKSLCTILGLGGLYSLVKLILEGCKSLRSLPGLAHLKSLQELNLSGSGVEDITDLGKLYRITHLDLGFCNALKTFPHLGHLTELEHLNVSGSGVDEISVLNKLHSLKKLSLSGCEALKWLPYLGHLTALAELNVDFTAVEEIPGVELLESLETMDCYRSQLRRMPDLRRLPHLQWMDLRGTPVTWDDPSSIYFERGIVMFGGEGRQGEGVSDESGCKRRQFDGQYREFYPPDCDTLN